MNSGRPSATALAAADYAGWAFVYGLFLVAVGFILAGAGHGVGSFFDISLSGLILWPIARGCRRWTPGHVSERHRVSAGRP